MKQKEYKCPIDGSTLTQSRHTHTSYICNQCKSLKLEGIFHITDIDGSKQQPTTNKIRTNATLYLNHELWINPGTVIKALQFKLGYQQDAAIAAVHQAGFYGRYEVSAQFKTDETAEELKKELDEFVYDDLGKEFPQLFSVNP
jgi:hypothetical protein